MQLSNEQVDTLLARINQAAKSAGAAVYGLPLIHDSARQSLRSIVAGWVQDLPSLPPDRALDPPHDHAWLPDETGGAYCQCGALAAGWYCPQSPTHLCLYDHDLDACDHCGQPEDRK